jgi:hypothetical protein
MDSHQTDDQIRHHPQFKELMDILRRQSPEQIARLQEYLEKLRNLPPIPPKEGHRFVVTKSKISATIDPGLLDLLEQARKSFDLSMSRMIETCVWEFFGRPALSFQQEGRNGESDQHFQQTTD